MTRMPTVTIGIPAHNEERNLPHLLADITKQNRHGYLLKHVVVVSDASTDATAQVARTYTTLPMQVIIRSKQRGKGNALNTIFEQAKTDAVVILDADVRLPDKNFLWQLVSPVIGGQADLTAARVMELPPINYFQRILATSMEFKKAMYTQFHLGNNVFTCHGRARAFSTKLYQTLRFPMSAGEDAYSYLYCLQHHLRYQYVDAAHAYYYLPRHLADHMLQSVRYFNHDNQLQGYFEPAVYQGAYRLPTGIVLRQLMSFALRRPIEMALYIAIAIGCKMYALVYRHHTQVWAIARSSK